VDPACGSGSFLIGAYQYLLDWHRDRYVEDGPEKHRKVLYKGHGDEWHLTIDEKKRILKNNIYGVDIDPQAVEVTRLSLLLKVLEGESEASLATQLRMFQERALPDLDDNIKCGNSLIGYDFYETDQASLLDDEEMYLVNMFDWKSEFPKILSGDNPGFDAVIGNPPYDVLEKERGATSWPHSALSEYVRVRPEYEQALGGKLNIFRFFVVRSLDLLRKDGWFGMIVPLALLADKSTSRTRRHLMLSSRHASAECFPQKDNPNRRIFRDAKLSTLVVACERFVVTTEQSAQLHVRVYPGNSFEDPFRENVVRLADAALLDPQNLPIPLVDARTWAVCKKVHSEPQVERLGEIEDFSVTRGEINQTIYRNYITEDETKARLVKGVEVGRYHVSDRLSQGRREWFDEERFLTSNRARSVVQRRRIATQRITGVDERLRIVATVIEAPAYFADSTNSIVLQDGSPYRLEYLLGLLNSALFQWRFKITNSNNNVGTNELDSMPFRTITFSDPEDVAQHDRMVELVERMLVLHERLAEAKIERERAVIGHQIEATDRQIDRLVYDLYGLTEEEIAVVEGRSR
jgi:Alw26I/Eco31I/Esp3I family type II restriction m6 adenine DNA methyltransferase